MRRPTVASVLRQRGAHTLLSSGKVDIQFLAKVFDA
jgi:hypothetical protein